MGGACGVLVDGDEAGNAAAFDEDFADTMAGGLGRGHAHIEVLGGDDGLVMDIEAVGEQEQLAGGEIGANFLGIQFGGCLIGDEHHDHVGPFSGFGDGGHFKAGLLGLGDGLGVGGEADLDLDAGVLEVEGVGVALGAVADDGDLLGLDKGEVGVVIVISLCHDFLDFLLVVEIL